MSKFQYKIGDSVRVLKASTQSWWYSSRIGQEFVITGQRSLGDGPNYATAHGLLLESDVELVVPVSKTLAQVVAEVAALDSQEAAANTNLASIAEHREKLRVELASFGLTLIAGEHSVTRVVQPKTMRELYEADAIKHGDMFTFIGPRNSLRDWNVGQDYQVIRIDSDDSVLLQDPTDVGCDEWAWENEGSFDRFVKAA